MFVIGLDVVMWKKSRRRTKEVEEVRDEKCVAWILDMTTPNRRLTIEDWITSDLAGSRDVRLSQFPCSCPCLLFFLSLHSLSFIFFSHPPKGLLCGADVSIGPKMINATAHSSIETTNPQNNHEA